MIVNSKKKETEHSKTCVLERDLGKIRKKVEIKRRNTIENKIQQKFTKGTEAVYSNVNVARDYYEGQLSDWKLLVKNYPRTYKRKSSTSSTKRLCSYIDSYEDFMQTHFE